MNGNKVKRVFLTITFKQQNFDCVIEGTKPSSMATGRLNHTRDSTENDDVVGGRPSTSCNPCARARRTRTATLLCTPCNERLCDDCCNIHEIYTPGIHTFVDYQDTANKRIIVDMKGFDRCEEHGNVVVYQCKDHDNKLCCKDCHYDCHTRCDHLVKLSHQAELHEQSSDQFFDEEIAKCISMANDVVSDSDKKSTDLQNDDICREIDRAKEKINKLLDEAKSRISLEVTNSDQEKLHRLANRKSRALTIKSELENSTSVNQSVQVYGTKIQKYIMHEVKRNTLSRAKLELNDLTADDYTEHRFLEWDEHLQYVLNMQCMKVSLKVSYVFEFV